MSSAESNYSDHEKQLMDFVMDFSNPFSDLFPELIDLKNSPNFMHKSYSQDSFDYFDDFNHSPSCSSSESDIKCEVLPSGPESDIPCPVDFTTYTHFNSSSISKKSVASFEDLQTITPSMIWPALSHYDESSPSVSPLGTPSPLASPPLSPLPLESTMVVHDYELTLSGDMKSKAKHSLNRSCGHRDCSDADADHLSCNGAHHKEQHRATRICGGCGLEKKRVYRYLGATAPFCNACNQHWRRHLHECPLCLKLRALNAAEELRGADITLYQGTHKIRRKEGSTRRKPSSPSSVDVVPRENTDRKSVV